jgi:hypothetical protein
MNQNSPSEVAANHSEISCLAFKLWEKAGTPEGRDLEFWLAAETKILAPQRPEPVKAGTVAAKPSSGNRVFASPFQRRATSGSAQVNS